MEKTAAAVLDRLYYSTGNFRIPKPGIRIVPTTAHVAAYAPGPHEILLEAKAYTVCRSFGRDSLSALAFLIGHELTHAFQNVGGATNFLAYDRAGGGSVEDEKTADIQGAFGAALAGFRTLDIIPGLIDRLYQAYDLKEINLQEYPGMDERQATAGEVSRLSNQLWNIFINGNYLVVLEQYEMAAKSYEYILRYYQGKEIYNNLGVLYAMQAMTFCGKNADPFLYPFEVDMTSRLSITRAADLSLSEQETRERLLAISLSYLDKALAFDGRYTEAYINRLCVRVQLGKAEEIIREYESGGLNQALRPFNPTDKQTGDVRQLAAVAYALAGSHNPGYPDRAQKLWQELGRHQHPQIQKMAKDNFAISTGKMPGPPPARDCLLAMSENTSPDGVSLFSYLNARGEFLDDFSRAEFFRKELPHSTVYLTRWQGNPFLFQRVHGPGVAAPGNISVGDGQQQLLRQLEAGSYHMIGTLRGYLVHIPACRLLFLVDEKGQIAEWTRYLN